MICVPKQQVRETQLQMQTDNLAEHISRRYQVSLREVVSDQTAVEKVLSVQLKRRQGGSSAPSLDANNGGEAASKSEAIEVNFEQIDVQKLIRDLTTQLTTWARSIIDAVHEYDSSKTLQILEGKNNDLTNFARELLDVMRRSIRPRESVR